MKLTIITPCTRPENLRLMKPGIDAGRDLFDIDWRIVFDTSVCDPVYIDGAIMTGVNIAGSRFGNGQRNAALSMIDDGWVYFLDDDNSMHPDFFGELYAAIKKFDAFRAFAFQQDASTFIRQVDIRVNRIDMAQVCIHRDLIDDLRFALHPYNADGVFIESLYRSNPKDWCIINKPLCYYNKLRSVCA